MSVELKAMALSHGIAQRFLKVSLSLRLVEGHGWLLHLLLAVECFVTIIANAILLYHLVEKRGRETLRRICRARFPDRVQRPPLAT